MITGFMSFRIEVPEQPYHRIRYSWRAASKPIKLTPLPTAITVHQGGEKATTLRLALAESARRNFKGVA